METTKYAKEKTLSRLQCICVCILLPILYGGIMEFVQEFFFPPRSAEWSDWIADVMGVVIGMCLFMFVNKKFKLNTNVTFF
ncbi:MAG: VanZ family protein [Paludibacteraceae bacterium]|nr:VanZ family protein [Paludibacteraceae bacterium]